MVSTCYLSNLNLSISFSTESNGPVGIVVRDNSGVTAARGGARRRPPLVQDEIDNQGVPAVHAQPQFAQVDVTVDRICNNFFFSH